MSGAQTADGGRAVRALPARASRVEPRPLSRRGGAPGGGRRAGDGCGGRRERVADRRSVRVARVADAHVFRAQPRELGRAARVHEASPVAPAAQSSRGASGAPPAECSCESPRRIAQIVDRFELIDSTLS